MKLFLIVISLLPFTTMLWAGGSSFEEGNKLLEAKDYDKAISAYEAYLESNIDLSAYYNLGIAYHSSGDHGKAIWAFESAAKLDPSDQQVLGQIDACKKEIDPSYSEVESSMLQSNIYSVSSTKWSVYAIICSFLVAIGILLGFKAQLSSKKRTYYILAAILLPLSILFVYFASITSSFEHQPLAIITKEATQLAKKNGQFEPTQKFIGAGSKVSIISEVGKGLVRVHDEMGGEFIIEESFLLELP